MAGGGAGASGGVCPRRASVLASVALVALLGSGSARAATRTRSPATAPEFGAPTASVTPVGSGTAAAHGERPPDASGQVQIDLTQGLEPPQLLQDSPAKYPQALEAAGVTGEVRLQLVIGVDGAVGEIQIAQGVHPELDAAALEAARGLKFKPAMLEGKPIPVQIEFSYQFVPPPRATAGERGGPQGIVAGLVRAKGTRKPVAGAALVLAEGRTVLADDEGRFELELPAGAQQIQVKAAGFRNGSFEEKVDPGTRVSVVYAIEPVMLNPYETIVRGERDRHEVSRVSLRNQELREVPGTMGDPFRVVMTLPGVGSVLSGLAYPVVRGSAPASTGYFLDGIRVPILFHMFLGPAVVHPDFVEGIDFFPGAPPPKFGRLLGGVIDGKISRPHEDRLHATAYADLINAGAFVEYPFESTDTNVTLAGRFSYTPWLIALAANSMQAPSTNGVPNPDLVMEFWDYQGRIEQKLGDGKLRLFGFGSSDLLGTESDNPYVSTGTQAVLFHRVDLRYQHPLLNGEVEFGGTWGLDRLAFDSHNASQLSTGFGMDEVSYVARASWSGDVGQRLKLTLGTDLERRQAHVQMDGYVSAFSTERVSLDQPIALATLFGAWSELVWKSEDAGWTVVPGLRLDNYHLVPGINHFVAEPRLTVRRKFSDAFTLKGAAGLYHQQPTTLIQLPVIDLASLEYGVQEGMQFDTGLEWKPPWGFEVTADVYFNPLIRTLELNPFDPQTMAIARGSKVSGMTDVLNASDVQSHGQAYGFELMVRRPMGGRWFGWLSYGLQRSSRWAQFDRFDQYGDVAGTYSGYLPYVFDQTHIVNGVLSVKLGTWTLGGGLHFNTGRPESGVMTSATMRQAADRNGRQTWARVDGDQVDRLPSFFRLDMRVAKSWAFDDFLLDAYLDVLNVTLSREIVAFTYLGGTYGGGSQLQRIGEGLPITLPLLGVKGSY